ncbi:histidine kinase [Streptomyces sp. NPDC058107]|uniref:histidine kinase n=1 Tax=Streptomyces sp. NPDC058107 TaxID=3346343 RepID=UPI0036E8BBF2
MLPWFVGRFWRQYQELIRAGWERAEHLEREQRLVAEQARLLERARIAQDMHDVLGHDLSLIALSAGALKLAPGRALRDRLDPSQRTAGPLFVHDQFQSLADRMGGNGADTDHDGSCRAGRVLAADRGPAQPDQQQPENDQGAVAGRLKKRGHPRRYVRNRSGHRPVRRCRSPLRDLGCVGLAQPARRKPHSSSGPRPVVPRSPADG